jgi:hypothetical protein
MKKTIDNGTKHILVFELKQCVISIMTVVVDVQQKSGVPAPPARITLSSSYSSSSSFFFFFYTGCAVGRWWHVWAGPNILVLAYIYMFVLAHYIRQYTHTMLKLAALGVACERHYLVMKRKNSTTASICSLGRQSYASKRAIAQLVETFKRDGLPEHCSRTGQYRARKGQCGTMTPYGTLVRPLKLALANGKYHDAAVQHPLAMLYYVSETCPDFAKLVRETFDAHPCDVNSPWSIVYYQDGIDPSDGLSSNHSRKSNIFYWSFLEFGMLALSNEANWFSVGFGRYSALQLAEGGITQLALKALMHFFGAEGCADIERDGVILKLHGGGTIKVFAKLGILLADEPAIKEVLCCKGHSGTKQCAICANGVAERAGPAQGLHAFSEYAVSTAVFDISKFKQHTDESIRIAVQRLDAMNPTVANTMEPLYGYTRNAYSLITNARIMLGVVSVLMYDWGHCYLCDGLLDAEFGLFMKHNHASRTSTSYAEFHDYAAPWVIPRALPAVLQLLTPIPARNNVKKGSFTASASEVLTLVPILLRYLMCVCMARGECMAHVNSLIAVLLVVELLQAVRTGAINPTQLRDAIEKHLNLFKDAYGTEFCRPKHHYVLHLPDILYRFGVLLHTLVQERRHRLVLRYGRDRDTLLNWDLGCLEEVTCHHIWELSQPYMKVGIQGAHRPTRSMMPLLREVFPHAIDADFRVASECKARNGGTIKVGDLVMFLLDTIRVGEVSMFVQSGSNELCVLSKWERDGGDVMFARYKLVKEASIMVPVFALECALTHRPSDDRSCTLAYIPFEYREQM